MSKAVFRHDDLVARPQSLAVQQPAAVQQGGVGPHRVVIERDKGQGAVGQDTVQEMPVDHAAIVPRLVLGPSAVDHLCLAMRRRMRADAVAHLGLALHRGQLKIAQGRAADVATLLALLDQCDDLAQTDPTPRGRMQEMELGMELHRSIARFSGNALLADVLDGLLVKCQVYVWMELTQLDEFRAAREDHRAIVTAIAARDADRACDRSRLHINQSRDGILGLLQIKRDMRESYIAKG